MGNNYNLIFYAKSNGETVEEHTQKVSECFNQLNEYLKLNDDEKKIIQKLIFYHDLGKKNPEFQNRMIKKLLGKKNFFEWKNGNIPHEWLSPAFITQEEENEIKTFLENLGLDKDRFFNFFIFTILSHHNRENQTPDKFLINDMIEWMKKNFYLNVEKYYDVKEILNIYNTSEKKEIWDTFFPYRIKWLGSLLKCDYCASAGISPEEKYEGNYRNDFNDWLKNKNFCLKDFQIKVGENSDKSIILVASTGMGKTEAAMNWINGEKAFYLLGIRIAVNEMYKRFKNIFGENVTLLHGETSYFFAQTETDEDEYEVKIEKARKLSYPLTIATADQLITSVFKYPGFEFTYLTCSYSKIVLDEIQSFSPSAIAAIVVFLKEIYKLGGRFMLMTATLPPFLIKEFKDLNCLYILPPQLSNEERHRISIIEDNDILSEKSKEIINDNKDKKILIICNTVKKSQEVYEFLKEDYSPQLIHSQFIGKDRKEKETCIMEATAPCIWISTQIVEASLDIDFDLLLTENASIESLLQRFGRCYRKREYTQDKPNIYIFKSDHQSIYDCYLFDKTWDVLKDYNNKIVSEADKQCMINKVFKDIENTDYFKKYKRQKDLLEIGYRCMSKIEAEEDFRNITNNYIVIPEVIYNENSEKINELIQFIEDKNNDKLERIKKQSELFEYTIPIQLYSNLNNLIEIPNSKFCKTHRIYILKGYEYSKEKGLTRSNTEQSDNIL